MSASILSNVRANVMTEQQQLVCSKAEKCGLQGFCIELSDQFSSPELYSSLSFEDRMNQCLDRELDNMSVKKFNNLYRNSRIDRRIYLDQGMQLHHRHHQYYSYGRYRCRQNNSGLCRSC